MMLARQSATWAITSRTGCERFRFNLYFSEQSMRNPLSDCFDAERAIRKTWEPALGLRYQYCSMTREYLRPSTHYFRDVSLGLTKGPRSYGCEEEALRACGGARLGLLTGCVRTSFTSTTAMKTSLRSCASSIGPTWYGKRRLCQALRRVAVSRPYQHTVDEARWRDSTHQPVTVILNDYATRR